ncbi:MAG: sigma-70 family RNA polymerase sigma factor [Sphingomonas sp.]
MAKNPDTESRLRDELLVVRCQLGERQAFEELVRIWAGPLLRHVQRVAGADMADDLAQEVWLRALRGIARLRDGARLRSWLFGVAHHVLMDRLRVRYAEREALDEVVDQTDPETLESSESLFALLETQLGALPVVERETLTLFYLEELSLVQIGEIQAVPIGTVKSRLFRAREMLRQSMLEGSRNGY